MPGRNGCKRRRSIICYLLGCWPRIASNFKWMRIKRCILMICRFFIFSGTFHGLPYRRECVVHFYFCWAPAVLVYIKSGLNAPAGMWYLYVPLICWRQTVPPPDVLSLHFQWYIVPGWSPVLPASPSRCSPFSLVVCFHCMRELLCQELFSGDIDCQMKKTAQIYNTDATNIKPCLSSCFFPAFCDCYYLPFSVIIAAVRQR